LFQTPEPFRVCVDRADIFLPDNGLRGGGTADLSEPPAVGRAPGGRARVAAIVSEPEGCETALGGLEVPEGLFAGAGEIAKRFILHCRDIHGGERP
jgi:hypothetical protein